jgi:hypothetical protein
MTKPMLLTGSASFPALSPTVRSRPGSKILILLVVVLAHWMGPSVFAQDTPSANSNPTTAKGIPQAEVPSELGAYGAGWSAKGAATLKFLGFKAYDITLWLPAEAGGNFSFNRPFALDIIYNTKVTASEINNTSLIEMSRISAGTPEQVNAWSAFLKNLFVDVKSGDRLIGVHLPAAGARFFLNGKLLGETSDAAFSEAFFRIWLDPKARKPDLRSALLGQ